MKWPPFTLRSFAYMGAEMETSAQVFLFFRKTIFCEPGVSPQLAGTGVIMEQLFYLICNTLMFTVTCQKYVLTICFVYCLYSGCNVVE